MGDKVSATMPDTMTAPDRVKANSRNNAPVKPPANALPEWRLDDLFSGRDDPKIELAFEKATAANNE